MLCGKPHAFDLYQSPDGVLADARHLGQAIAVNDIGDVKVPGKGFINIRADTGAVGCYYGMFRPELGIGAGAENSTDSADEVKLRCPVLYRLFPKNTGAELPDEDKACPGGACLLTKHNR